MSTPSASNADEPPQEENHQPSSISSLPEEIVLSCLARVPRSHYLNLSCVSKTLRSLVRSPELNRLRSLLYKKSLYVYFHDDNDQTYRWLTLRPIEKTAIEYRLVPIPFPSHPFMYGSSTVVVGSEIYFVVQRSSDIWILDTRSGKFTQGPSMKVRREVDEGVGVIDGKIYVMSVVGFAGPDEEIQVQVFDPKLKIWKLAGREKVKPRPWCMQCIASLEQKVYMVEGDRISVYNPREGRRKRLVHMVSKRLAEYNPREGRRKETIESIHEFVYCMCVVDNVLYACFNRIGLLWFDTKLNVWRRLVSRDGKELSLLGVQAMAEYEGKLAVFKSLDNLGQLDKTKSVNISMFLFTLDRVGERICGTIEWSGVVATIPYSSYWDLHCLAVSD